MSTKAKGIIFSISGCLIGTISMFLMPFSPSDRGIAVSAGCIVGLLIGFVVFCMYLGISNSDKKGAVELYRLVEHEKNLQSIKTGESNISDEKILEIAKNAKIRYNINDAKKLLRVGEKLCAQKSPQEVRAELFQADYDIFKVGGPIFLIGIVFTLVMYVIGSSMGTSGSSSNNKCAVCGKTISTSADKNSVYYSNMCSQCSKNYDYATGK